MADTGSVKGVAGSTEAGRERARESAIGGAVSEVVAWPQRTKAFLSEVRAETKRVTWPTLLQVRVTTVIVMVTVAFFATYFGVLDWLFTQLMQAVLQMGR